MVFEYNKKCRIDGYIETIHVFKEPCDTSHLKGYYISEIVDNEGVQYSLYKIHNTLSVKISSKPPYKYLGWLYTAAMNFCPVHTATSLPYKDVDCLCCKCRDICAEYYNIIAYYEQNIT